MARQNATARRRQQCSGEVITNGEPGTLPAHRFLHIAKQWLSSAVSQLCLNKQTSADTARRSISAMDGRHPDARKAIRRCQVSGAGVYLADGCQFTRTEGVLGRHTFLRWP